MWESFLKVWCPGIPTTAPKVDSPHFRSGSASNVLFLRLSRSSLNWTSVGMTASPLGSAENRLKLQRSMVSLRQSPVVCTGFQISVVSRVSRGLPWSPCTACNNGGVSRGVSACGVTPLVRSLPCQESLLLGVLFGGNSRTRNGKLCPVCPRGVHLSPSRGLPGGTGGSRGPNHWVGHSRRFFRTRTSRAGCAARVLVVSPNLTLGGRSGSLERKHLETMIR